jgi:hypothetical protein
MKKLLTLYEKLEDGRVVGCMLGGADNVFYEFVDLPAMREAQKLVDADQDFPNPKRWYLSVGDRWAEFADEFNKNQSQDPT